MSIRLLGQFEAQVDGHEISLGGPRQRALVGMLLCVRPTMVSTDRLIDGVWGDDAPPTAITTLRSYVSRLRQLLDPPQVRCGPSTVLVGGPTGYALKLPDEAIDAWRFEEALRQARQVSETDPVKAVALLEEGLGLWRGTAYAEVAAQPWAAGESLRLEELRLAARELLVEQTLRVGRPAEAASSAQALTVEHPLREESWRLLAIALWGSQRQADALEALRRCRAMLASEIGVDPGPALVDLEQDILAQRVQALERWIGHPAVILHGHGSAPPEVESAAVEPVRPRQLPAPPRWFTGRASELARLDTILAEAPSRPGAVVAVVSGTAGVGKTSLALHWAHRVADRFPDGQLFVDLRGFGPPGSAMKPAEAVRLLLGALDVAPQRVPAGIDAQASLLRSLLTGTRVLLLLDNAGGVEQVRPLLPATTGCMALVTSRTMLSGLVAVQGADHVPLARFSVAQTRALLVERLGPARVDAEPEAVEQVAARCAGLPLALAVVAARVATRPRSPLQAVADEFGDGLDVLDGGDTSTDVRSVLSWSYLALSAPAARLMRLLALHPGQDLSAAAAASLCGESIAKVRAALSELLDANLLDEHVPGRFSLHELLRMYAAELSHAKESAAESDAALARLLDHYLHTAHAAALLVHTHRHAIALGPAVRGTVVTAVADIGQALAWFTAEHANLLAVTSHAEAKGHDEQTWQLAWTLTDFLDRHGHWHDQAAVQKVALRAAERLDDLTGRANCLRALARVCVQLGQNAEAAAHYRHAMDLFARLGDAASHAHTHLGLSWILHRQSRTHEAITHDRQALQLFQELDHPLGQARSLNHLGTHLTSLGENEAALEACSSALALYEQVGDRFGIAAASDSLAGAYQRLGRHDEALVHYGRAVDLLRQLDDRYYTALVLTHLGDAHMEVGSTEGAREAWSQALELLKHMGHPDAAQLGEKLGGLPALSA